MNIERRRQISLATAASAVVVGTILGIHDTILVAAVIGAAGLLWSTQGGKAWATAAVFVCGGLFWSSLDGRSCSAWYRGRTLAAKLAGQIPYVAWKDVSRAIFSDCHDPSVVNESSAGSIALLEEKTLDGQKLERYRTTLGDFWITAPGQETIAWIVWELTTQSYYESGDVVLHPGDTVLDCGAHVGLFTRYALGRGAGYVVAIEPDPTNLYCLRENLADEIASGKVTVIEAGVWDSRTNLTLYRPEDNPGANSFVWEFQERLKGVPVMPLDDIVEEVKLARVDFIKMDIEGSERRALLGAKRTLERFKPRLAICTYHRPDDAKVIPQIIGELREDYRMHAKDLAHNWGSVNPKVVFFD